MKIVAIHRNMKIVVIRRNMYTNRRLRKELQRVLRNSLKYFENSCETSHQYAPCKSKYVTARMSGECSAVELMRRRVMSKIVLYANPYRY